MKAKKILIISPQLWGEVRVSKHHYATTLASLGNRVFFLNPPEKNLSGVSVKESGVPGLAIVSYNPFFPIEIRFKSLFIFRWLMVIQVIRIIKAIGEDLDIVWCFDPNLFADLTLFKAKTKIFHPVDVFRNESALRVARSADILFSVSPSILDYFKALGKPSFFINHGLGETFAAVAAGTPSRDNKAKDICYVGNLLIPYMDRQLVRKMIEAFPDKRFHFVGPYETSSLGSGDNNATDFISYLKAAGNVVLHGPKNTTDMCRIMEGMDAFVLCYTGSKEGYDLSNSHKMLEYLSTGKPIISTPIRAYEDYRHLVAMPPHDMPESEYPVFFESSIMFIGRMASPELSKERKGIALENTYLKQVQRISDILKRSKLI